MYHHLSKQVSVFKLCRCYYSTNKKAIVVSSKMWANHWSIAWENIEIHQSLSRLWLSNVNKQLTHYCLLIGWRLRFSTNHFLTKMGWTKSAKYETYTFGAYFVNMPIFKAVIIYLLCSTLLLPLFNCKISADFESNYRRPPSSLPKKDSSLLTINQKRNKCIL